MDFGAVQANNHQVPAEIYFAEPKGEAEAIALVRLRTGNTYFLDFGAEKVRLGSDSEYMRLPRGVWSFRALPNGNFVEPLASEKMNEFRITAENGQKVPVHEALLAEIYQVQSAIGQMTGYPQVGTVDVVGAGRNGSAAALGRLALNPHCTSNPRQVTLARPPLRLRTGDFSHSGRSTDSWQRAPPKPSTDN